MATTMSSFTALPEDVLQRVLLGVARDDHDATAAACRAFRAVIRGPRFLRLRREYGFAERGIILVGHSDDEGPLEIRSIHFPNIQVVASIDRERGKLHSRALSTTDEGGARLFVSTTRYRGYEKFSDVLAVNCSSRRWSRFATLPLDLRAHCIEWHAGLLYIAGGVGGLGSYLNSLRAFNEATGSWEDLPPMPVACAMAASGVIGNELFIAGGRGADHQHYLSTLQIYDFTARTWRLGAPLPLALRGACGVVVDRKLYLVSTKFSDVRSRLVYDVQSNTWDQQIPRPNRLASDGAMHAFAHNDPRIPAFAHNDLIVGVHRHNLTFYHENFVSGLGLGTPGIMNAVGGSVVIG